MSFITKKLNKEQLERLNSALLNPYVQMGNLGVLTSSIDMKRFFEEDHKTRKVELQRESWAIQQIYGMRERFVSNKDPLLRCDIFNNTIEHINTMLKYDYTQEEKKVLEEALIPLKATREKLLQFIENL